MELNFKGEVEGWVVNFMSDHYWRVENLMEREDLMQEARMLHHELVGIYSGKVDGPHHFMALFKTSFKRHVHDLSTKNTRHKVTAASPYIEMYEDGDEVNIIDQQVGEVDNPGFLSSSFSDFSDEVREVLSIMLAAPVEVVELVSSAVITGKRQNLANQCICNLAGRDPDHEDLIDAVRCHFNCN